MNDEDYSTIYDTVQKDGVYEDSEQPAEHGGALYDDVLEDLRSEDNLYVNELETHEYDLVSALAVVEEKDSLASLQPETGEYLLPDDVRPEVQDLEPGEPQEDRGISVEELYSPIQEQESDPEEPQENGGRMEEDLPSPSSYTIQRSRAFSTSGDSLTSSSAADAEENKSASTSPKINLFVKGELLWEMQRKLGEHFTVLTTQDTAPLARKVNIEFNLDYDWPDMFPFPGVAELCPLKMLEGMWTRM
ncbi:hypothetical protein CB1_001402110 [Camelus ferus]|nr:hypothetical protein CB1_001402110 [Camelus ferus]